MTAITLPVRCRGRMSADAQDRYDVSVEAFCQALIEIGSTLDFKMSSRGWAYFLEPYGLDKGDFRRGQDLINDCRKSGLLPIDEDSAQAYRDDLAARRDEVRDEIERRVG